MGYYRIIFRYSFLKRRTFYHFINELDLYYDHSDDDDDDEIVVVTVGTNNGRLCFPLKQKSDMINCRKVSKYTTFLLMLFSFVWIRKFVNMPWFILDHYVLLKHSSFEQMCKLPQVNPFDPSILSYISKPEPLRCKQIQPNLIFMDDDGVLHVNDTVVQSTGFDTLECSYRCFSHNDGIDDDTLKYDEWTTFKSSVMVQCEFIEVTLIQVCFTQACVYAHEAMLF